MSAIEDLKRFRLEMEQYTADANKRTKEHLLVHLETQNGKELRLHYLPLRLRDLVLAQFDSILSLAIADLARKVELELKDLAVKEARQLIADEDPDKAQTLEAAPSSSPFSAFGYGRGD